MRVVAPVILDDIDVIQALQNGVIEALALFDALAIGLVLGLLAERGLRLLLFAFKFLVQPLLGCLGSVHFLLQKLNLPLDEVLIHGQPLRGFGPGGKGRRHRGTHHLNLFTKRLHLWMVPFVISRLFRFLELESE